MMQTRSSSIRYPLIGIAALAMAASGTALTFASYNKVFTRSVPVTVVLDRAQEQLDVGADVRLRGVRIGEVRDLTPTSDGGVGLHVALDPSMRDKVPSDVVARVLPKTLFGERYVELVSSGASMKPLLEGASIPQDVSRRSVELQDVFDDLGPMLQAVQPDKLNAALSGLATAVSGRGEKIGRTIENVAAYSGELRELLPSLSTNLALVDDVATSYDKAAPALLGLAYSASTTARTIYERRELIATLLAGIYGLSSRGRDLLVENEDRIVRLAATLRPTLKLLADYAPEYDCVFNGAKVAIKRIYDVFGGDDGPFKIRGRLRLGQSRGVYPKYLAPNSPHAQELVAALARYGPSCPLINSNSVGGTPNVAIPAPALELIGTYRGLLGLPATPFDTGLQQESEWANPQTANDDVGSLVQQLVSDVDQQAGSLVTGNSVLNLLLGPLLGGPKSEENP